IRAFRGGERRENVQRCPIFFSASSAISAFQFFRRTHHRPDDCVLFRGQRLLWWPGRQSADMIAALRQLLQEHEMKNRIGFVSGVVFAATGVRADEPLAWPRFRGPNGSGVAEGQKPPLEFGPDKNVRWKVAVPPGISSPIVAGE